MFEKGKRQRRQSEEDKVFNRMLFWLAGALVVVNIPRQAARVLETAGLGKYVDLLI